MEHYLWIAVIGTIFSVLNYISMRDRLATFISQTLSQNYRALKIFTLGIFLFSVCANFVCWWVPTLQLLSIVVFCGPVFAVYTIRFIAWLRPNSYVGRSVRWYRDFTRQMRDDSKELAYRQVMEAHA